MKNTSHSALTKFVKRLQKHSDQRLRMLLFRSCSWEYFDVLTSQLWEIPNCDIQVFCKAEDVSRCQEIGQTMVFDGAFMTPETLMINMPGIKNFDLVLVPLSHPRPDDTYKPILQTMKQHPNVWAVGSSGFLFLISNRDLKIPLPERCFWIVKKCLLLPRFLLSPFLTILHLRQPLDQARAKLRQYQSHTP